ncbi:MAG TPA: hypothetical protein DD396_03695 [Bacteroidetes bacterium]|jgi:hypothetical protein|nr:hypothetical protein [Bacteroidota bacterium]|tara:strand:+ start:13968 stop:14693 length:726 start_codon:yes stop_codon:yes gene_type:complete
MKQVILLLSIFLCSCQRGDDCFTNKGANGSISRKLEVFDKISVENRINLIITQDSAKAGEVVISGPENLLEEITTDVSDGWLKIKNMNTCNFVRSYDYELTINVFLKELRVLNIDGIASVKTEDTLLIKKLDIEHLALSDIHLTLSGDEVFLRSRNSAHTRLDGKIKVFKGSIEEISDVDAEFLKAEEVLLDTHSPLDCIVNASKGIFVKIYGPGSILYVYEPSEYKIVDVQLSSGRLRKK